MKLTAIPAPPPKPSRRARYSVWSSVARGIAEYPIGTWLKLEGLRATARPESSIVVACQRRGFRVAIRRDEDGALFILRGRPIEKDVHNIAQGG